MFINIWKRCRSFMSKKSKKTLNDHLSCLVKSDVRDKSMEPLASSSDTSTVDPEKHDSVKETLNSIYATATITNKPENQDYRDKITTPLLKSIMLADGLGSYKYAKESSETAVKTVYEQLHDLKNLEKLDFEAIYKKAHEKLKAMSCQNGNKSLGDLYGTTLIVLVETERKIKIAYTGNGAIWHIRGNFDDKFHKIFVEGYPEISITWNAVNLLNPHSVPENGKEALYRLISDDTEYDYTPTVIEIDKDKRHGDIFMICSDGIFSADHTVVRPSKTENIYVKYEMTIKKFFEHLTRFFEAYKYTDEELNNAINRYLSEVKPDLEDDATMGVLITSKVLDFHNLKKSSDR